jgi:hypothetical protein
MVIFFQSLPQVKQTIYHVYAIDTSTNKEWELWKPKPKNERTEVDTMATELVVNSQSFPSLNGYCWVDMHALIQECDKLVRTCYIILGYDFLILTYSTKTTRI